MLFVNDSQAQVLEVDYIAQHSMRTDQHVH